MSDLHDMTTGFIGRLDGLRDRHTQKTAAEVGMLREVLSREISLPPAPDLSRRLSAVRQSGAAAPSISPRPAGLDLSSTRSLQELDRVFFQLFNLDRYYSAAGLAYPTILCETLEQFIRPMFEDIGLSQTQFNHVLQKEMEDAQQSAQKGGAGTFGVNLPGRGAYLNGWLFTYGTNIPPSRAMQNPALAARIFSTAIHEKLGHGFIAAYSALGAVKTRLGLDRFALAQRFGLQTAQDPLSNMQEARHGLIFHASQLLEEGWATWIQNYMGASLLGFTHPMPDLRVILDSLQHVQAQTNNPTLEIQSLQTALLWLFGEVELSAENMKMAIRLLERYGDYFAEGMMRPLRYLAGEQLLGMAARNLGEQCVPYAVLIAANVTYDLEKMALSDMEMVLTDTHYNPDMRLLALSLIDLPQKNNPRMLAEIAFEHLNMIVPPALKQPSIQ